MRIYSGETPKAKIDRLKQWHPYFAFLPVTVVNDDGTWELVWMEDVERRLPPNASYWDSFHAWEFRRVHR